MVNQVKGLSMKRHIYLLAILLCLVSLLSPIGKAVAQDYSFNLGQRTIHVFWQADGSASIDYRLKFNNNPNGRAIDYIDVGTPNQYYETSSISADIDGHRLTDISDSGYQGDGTGFAVGLGSYKIQPGKSGTVHIFIGRITNVLYPDDNDQNYASAVFSPFWFGSSYVSGSTPTSVTFHLPPGISETEPRWHSAPDGFTQEPTAAFDDEGRITYTWTSTNSSSSGKYIFGASFPKAYVPAESIQRKNPFAWLANINLESLFPFLCIGSVIVFIFFSNYSEKKRRLEYLPPSISIEGNGIKRGLTAIEAAILLEEPLDKVLTMLLFAVIKKGAAVVTKSNPLQVDKVSPGPQDLRTYETDFLNAITIQEKRPRELALRKMMVDLIKSTTVSMKGFSRRETVNYYKNIMEKAWQQVEDANTPQIKSDKFDEVMEWTMLDRKYDDRTKRVFQDSPIFIPRWWGGFDPTYRRTMTSFPINQPTTGPTTSGGLPHLPGSDFAASVVNQVQGFSSNVVSNITEFTSSVTSTTNPPPVTTSSSSSSRGSSGGGRSCACACACAGCACACAGGGR